MKRIIKSLAAVALFAAAFAAHAQTVVTGSYITIAAPGSYVLGGNAYTVTITASNVTLDLGGYTVASSHTCNLINNGASQGCTCTVANCNSSTPGIKATGNNIAIRHGRVEHQFGDGISIVSPTGYGLVNAVVEDVTVDNNSGNGVAISGSGAELRNVRSYQNGHDGIALYGDNTRLEHVTASYNNGDGVDGASGAGNYSDVFTSWNKGYGMIGNGNLARIEAKYNAMAGILPQGTLRESTAEYNVGDGVLANQYGVVLDSAATGNSGNGFSFGAHTCYAHLASNSNTVGAVAGGVAMTGSVTSCN